MAACFLVLVTFISVFLTLKSAFAAGWLVVAGVFELPMVPGACASAGQAIRLTAMTAAASFLNMVVSFSQSGCRKPLGLFGRPAFWPIVTIENARQPLNPL